MTDRNCISYWFPRLREAGLPVPPTRIVQTAVDLDKLVDGELPEGWDGFLSTLKALAKSLGPYPLFLRTGQTSGKHEWLLTCYVPSEESLESHVSGLVHYSHEVSIAGLPVQVWAVRKLLDVDPLFRCMHYGEMPVVRELRVFAVNGGVRYCIPYWPKQALAEGAPDDPDWQAIYAERYQFTREEADEARSLASKASKACGGAWSVDVLFARDGAYVTDMAAADQSWGYDARQIETGVGELTARDFR